jgi:hypothetical protein
MNCANTSNNNPVDFSKISKDFNDSLLIHFPKKIKGEYFIESTAPSGVRYSNRCGVTLVVNQDSVSIYELIKKVKDSSVIVKSEEKKIIFVNGFWSEGGGAIFMEYYKKKYGSSSYIVLPYFYKLLKDNRHIEFTTSGNLKGYDIYIIEVKKGKFLEQNNLSFGYGLPDEWKNGLTRGIAINKNKGVVIYWLEIW